MSFKEFLKLVLAEIAHPKYFEQMQFHESQCSYWKKIQELKTKFVLDIRKETPRIKHLVSDTKRNLLLKISQGRIFSPMRSWVQLQENQKKKEKSKGRVLESEDPKKRKW